jgi:hypothetical protein
MDITFHYLKNKSHIFPILVQGCSFQLWVYYKLRYTTKLEIQVRIRGKSYNRRFMT